MAEKLFKCGAVNRTRNGIGNGSTQRKPTLISLCPPKIPQTKYSVLTGTQEAYRKRPNISYTIKIKIPKAETS
jgi:hypothetical protein